MASPQMDSLRSQHMDSLRSPQMDSLRSHGIRIDKGRLGERIFITPNTPINVKELAAVIWDHDDSDGFRLWVDGDPNWRTYILPSIKVMRMLQDIRGRDPDLSYRYRFSLVSIDNDKMDKHFAEEDNIGAVVGERPKREMEVPGLYIMIPLDKDNFMIVDFFEYEFKHAESLMEIAFSLEDQCIYCYYKEWVTMKLAEFQTKVDATRFKTGKRCLSRGVIDIIASYAADGYTTNELREAARDLRY